MFLFLFWNFQIRVEFNPTVPHCSLATLIGLCLRIKIERNIPHRLKLDIFIKKGAHSTEDESKSKTKILTPKKKQKKKNMHFHETVIVYICKINI